MTISKAFVTLDQTFDYIPFMSTISNTVDLTIKAFVLPALEQSTIDSDDYWKHLNEKSFLRCMILLIVLIGNLLFLIYSLWSEKKVEKNEIIESIKHGTSLRDLDPKWINDEQIVIAAIKHNPDELAYAGLLMRDNQKIVDMAITIDGKTIRHASERLQKDEGLLKKIVEKDPSAAEVFHQDIKEYSQPILNLVSSNVKVLKYLRKFNDNVNFMTQAIHINSRAYTYGGEEIKKSKQCKEIAYKTNQLNLIDMTEEEVERILNTNSEFFKNKENTPILQFLNEKVQNNLEVVAKLCDLNFCNLHYASDDLKKKKEFILERVRNNGLALQFASRELQNDKAIVMAAVQQNGSALQFASERLKREFREEEFKQNI